MLLGATHRHYIVHLQCLVSEASLSRCQQLLNGSQSLLSEAKKQPLQCEQWSSLGVLQSYRLRVLIRLVFLCWSRNYKAGKTWNANRQPQRNLEHHRQKLTVGKRRLLVVRKHTHAADTQKRTLSKAEGDLGKLTAPISSKGLGFKTLSRFFPPLI